MNPIPDYQLPIPHYQNHKHFTAHQVTPTQPALNFRRQRRRKY
ncbi:hypothetical protein [Gloeocapsopsis dulcis]|nr:hypothetical protein [Gloeocapsopsis dulcis]WNN90964.1 hypothetical protein P0S91_07785 [Gloeocapsopsis dulcis]